MEEKIDLYRDLETERLLLRKITVEDAEELYKNVYSNYDYIKFYFQVPLNTFEDYLPLVEKYKGWYDNGNHFGWGIMIKETKEMIGHIQLHSKDGLNNNCKIAYVIGYDFRKKGYAREAVRAVLNFGLNIANYHRIDAEIVYSHVDSIALVEAVGMSYEYTRKDGYKLGDDYYDQRVYTLIKKEDKKRVDNG